METKPPPKPQPANPLPAQLLKLATRVDRNQTARKAVRQALRLKR